MRSVQFSISKKTVSYWAIGDSLYAYPLYADARLRPWQTRKHCCGNIVADANVSASKRETFVADAKCFWKNSETFFASRTQNLLSQQMLRARANGETCGVRNNVSATMLPQQCFLVCHGLYTWRAYLRTCMVALMLEGITDTYTVEVLWADTSVSGQLRTPWQNPAFEL